MVKSSRVVYPQCRGTEYAADPRVPRPVIPMLSLRHPQPIHVITVDIHEFLPSVIHVMPGPRRATTGRGTNNQDRWRSFCEQPTGPASYRTAAGDRT